MGDLVGDLVGRVSEGEPEVWGFLADTYGLRFRV